MALAVLAGVPLAQAQAPLHKIGEMELALLGVSASVEPASPVIPKNIASGVRIVVRAGAAELTADEVARFLGPDFEVHGELSGPGLPGAVSLPRSEDPRVDPLILSLPAIPVAGDYALTNLRIVSGGRPVLDLTPAQVTVQVIDQILVTSVKTRPLTLDEIRAKGIVLDGNDYTGFEFTLGLKLDSKLVKIDFPVAFDRQGVAVPQPLLPPPVPWRGSAPMPTVVPLLLAPEGGGGGSGSGPNVDITLPDGKPVRIPSVLVIPGSVGYLKQFFSAQLYVSNGAPVGSGLVVRNVTGTLQLPPGPDHEPGTSDDPLALPDTVDGPQPGTMPVRGLGPDGEPGTGDDVDALPPAEQGQAEFLVRGEKEGFHPLSFGVRALLEGLPTGPVAVTGLASGGVLVRNPYFSMTFTLPATVRTREAFKMFVTVTNISQALANDVHVSLDSAAMSGLRLIGADTQRIDTLKPRDSQVLAFEFESLRTGQVVASYLNLDTDDGTTGRLQFTAGVGERGVALSPDTLVLPATVDALPQVVVDEAMRVLGQAWSIANAPHGTLPSGVVRTNGDTVRKKALALAEAGLRVTLGQPEIDAVRDLLFDFWGGERLDPGFDQLLRTTDAGRDLARALGVALDGAAATAGGPLLLEREMTEVAAAGPDFVVFVVARGSGGAPVGVALVDGAGRRTVAGSTADVPGSVILPLGDAQEPPLLGLLTAPTSSPYVLELTGRGTGHTDVALTIPRGDGAFLRVTLSGLDVDPGSRHRAILDLARPDSVVVETDLPGGVVERTTHFGETIRSAGPTLLSASVIGPETLDGASPMGVYGILLFDRIVDAASAAVTDRYEIPQNRVLAAKRQLSGRLVFVAFEQPEGPYVATSIDVDQIADARGTVASGSAPLVSRLEDPGAVVTGRVFNADGTDAPGAVVTYLNGTSRQTGDAPAEVRGVSEVTVGPHGEYELRYVRQDPSGFPFRLATRDPQTGSVREVSAYVRASGQRIVLDIALLGRGNVSGTIRDLSGRAVPAAYVVARSATDPQSGGAASADGDGRYTISGISVGPITVQASRGTSLGTSTGRIDRAGTTAVVDVTLDGGAVRASGVVSKVENGVVTPLPGLLVLYTVQQAVVGAAYTDASGRYVLDAMPIGAYQIDARYGPHLGRASGTAAAGDAVAADIFIQVPPTASLGTVRGLVRLGDGSRVPGVVVSVGPVATVTSDDPLGTFELAGVPVLPGQSQTIVARTRDGLRSGTTAVVVDEPGEVVEGVTITLSGLATAEFTALDPAGQPLRNLEVALAGSCTNPCGCTVGKTDENGRVRFPDVPLGSAWAKAVRVTPGHVDATAAMASLTGDGQTGFAVLQFKGAGSVVGTVLDPDGNPSRGVDVSLRSLVFRNDGRSVCGLLDDVSHAARTDENGRFRFTGVSVGPVGVTATDPFTGATVGARKTLTRHGEEVPVALQFVNTFAGELSGTIVLPDGTTPAGAGIQVSTDAQGGYHFAEILPEGRYTVTARDPLTGGVARQQIYLRAGMDARHDLRLKGKGTVRVLVVDGADQAVERAAVRLQELEFPGGLYEAVVEPSGDPAGPGHVTFEGVFEGPVSVEAKDAFGRGGRSSTIVPGPGETVDVKVRLTVTGTVRGRFLMPDGTPIPYGTVKLLAGGRVLGQTTTVGSGDEVGSFFFDYVPAGSVRLEAQDPLTGRTGFAVGTLENEGQVLDLDVFAQGLGTVTGLVTGNGTAQPGASVEIVSGSYRAATLSDSEGRYRVAGVPEGRVVATASLSSVTHALAGTAAATLSGDGQTLELDVALRDSGRVEGVVTRVGGDQPAPTSVVTITVGGLGGGTQTTSTKSDGSFALERVPAGVATLAVDVLGSIDRAQGTADVPAGGTVTVPLQLHGVGSLRGTAWRGTQTTAGTLFLQGTGAFPYQQTLTLGEDGAFRLPEVLAGSFTARLSVWTGSLWLYGSASGVVEPGTEAHVDVFLQPTGSVTGLVVRGDGTSPAYGTVVAADLADFTRVTAQAQADGTFTLTGVPLKGFTLRLSDPLTKGLAVRTGLRLETDGQVLDVGRIVLDDGAPVIRFLEPADGTTKAALGGPLVLELTDAGAGVDASSLLVVYGSAGAHPLGFEFDGTRATSGLYVPALAVGANTLRATVRDQAGNVGEALVTLTVTGGTIRGEVVRGASAVAGAAVQVVVLPPVTAGRDGRFVQTGLRPGTHLVRATDPATGLAVERSVELPDGEDVTADLALPPYGRIAGVVQHAGDQSPAGGVEVIAGARRAVSDAASGRFDLGFLPLGAYTLSATDPSNGDRGEARVELTTQGQEIEAPIRLNGVGSATVVVSDFGGASVAGAAVTLTTSSPFGGSWSGTTGPDGRVLFANVLAGTLTAAATGPTGLRGEETSLLPDRGDVTIAVRLQAAGRIAGTVFRADGSSPAAGIALALSGPKTATAASDASGRFAFEGVPVGPFAVDATDPSDGDRGRATGTVAAAATAPADIVLNGLGEVRVLVVQDGDQPAAGAAVTLASSSPFAVTRYATTGADGRATFAGAFGGHVTASAFLASASARGQSEGDLAPGGALDLTVTLEPLGTVHGRVLAPVTGEPVSGVEVRLAGPTVRVVTTAADGVFTFADVRLGTYALEARVGGRLRAYRADVVLGTAGEAVADLTLVETGTVQGLVTDPSGAPAAGARVDLASSVALYGGASSAAAGTDGRYTIDGVPVGSFTLTATLGSDRADASGAVAVHGQVVTVDVALLNSAVRLPLSVKDGNDLDWQVREDGSLAHGVVFPSAARTPRLTLVAGGTPHAFSGPAPGSYAGTEEARREVALPQAGIAGLDVTRKVFVPADGYFVRSLDLLRNPGPDAVTVDVVVESDLGDADVVATASGDGTFDAGEAWLVLDDADAGDVYASASPQWEFAPLAVVLSGGGGAAPSLATLERSGGQAAVTARWNAVVVPPGTTVGFLHLYSAQADRARGTAAAERLAQLAPEALAGLSADEAAAVWNFAVPATSALPSLPPNDGAIAGRVTAWDGATPVPSVPVTFRSRSPYYGRPLTATADAAGSFDVRASLAGVVRLVPRGAFDVTATSTRAGTVTASASGTFPSTGIVDLTTAPGRAVGASSAFSGNGPEKAVDGDLSTHWRSAVGDSASQGRPAHVELLLPSEATVHEVRLRGVRGSDLYDMRRARVDLLRAAGDVLWSAELDLPLPERDADLPVPGVAGVRSVRVTSLADSTSTVGLAELEVRGEGALGPTGRVVEDVAFAGTGLVQGQVLRADGSPVTGGSVRLAAAGISASAVPAADGGFLYPVVVPGDYTLTAVHPQGSVSVSAPVTVAGGAFTRQDLVYPAFGGVHGALSTAVGSPAGGTVSLVAAGFERSVTAPATTGSYAFADVPPGPYAVTATDARSGAVETRTVDVAAGPSTGLDVAFPPVGSVRVRATLAGAPYAGGRVSLQADVRGPAWAMAGTTDAAGERVVANVPGPTFRARVSHADSDQSFGEATGSLVDEGITVTVDVAVPGVGTVAGTLRSRDGAPQAGTVSAVHATAPTVLASAATDYFSGGFQLSNVPVGAFRLRGALVTSVGGTTVYSRADVPALIAQHGDARAADALLPKGTLAPAGLRHLWELDLAAGAPVNVRLLGEANGAAQALADPFLEVLRPDGSLAAANDDAGPFDEGSRVAFTADASGRYVVVARAAGAQTGGYRLGSERSDEVHVFRPYSGATLAGRVTRSEDGAAVAAQRLRFSGTAQPSYETATAADGTYVVPLLAAGDFTVEALDTLGVVVARASGTSAGGNALLDLTVPARETVSVTVRRGSDPLAGVEVTLASDHPTALPEDRLRIRTADATGRVSAVLPVGHVVARVVDPESGVAYEAAGDLAVGTPLDLTILISTGVTTVRGLVTNGDGAVPLPGAAVDVDGQWLAVTDAAGAYRIDGVPAGTRVLTVAFGAVTATRTLALAGGEAVEDVRLPLAVLRGRVAEPDTAPLVASVEACGYSASSVWLCVQTTSGADGRYAFLGLPAWRTQSVSVTARLADGSGLATVRSFSYAAGFTGTQTVDLTFPATGTVLGTVRDADGATVAAATVDLYTSYGSRLQSAQADAVGDFRFPHVLPQSVVVFAADADGIPGTRTGASLANQTTRLDVELAAAGTLAVDLRDEAGGSLAASVTVEALEAPALSAGTAWRRPLDLSQAASVRVPAGAFRVVFAGDGLGGPSGADGVVPARGAAEARLRRGTHQWQPQTLTGDLGVYETSPGYACYGDVPCTSAVGTRITDSVEFADVARPEMGERALRSLLTAGGRLRVRRQHFVPASGAFIRTLTLLTNPGPDAVTAPLDSALQISDYQTGVLTTADGDAQVEPSDGFVVLRPAEPSSPDRAVVLGTLPAASLWFYGGEEDLGARHDVLVPAGETRAFLTFALQRPQGADAAAEAQALLDLTHPEALLGLTPEERAMVVNFDVPVATSGVLGVVETPAGAPVAGARVLVQDAEGVVVADAAADASGEFTLVGFGPGEVTVFAVDPVTGRPGQVAATVVDGSLAPVVVRLLGDDAVGTVRVRAVREGTGAPVSGVVHVYADGFWGIWQADAALDASGEATIPGIPAGWIEADTGEPPDVGWAGATLPPGGVVDVTLVVGERSWMPVNLSGSDGQQYWVFEEGDIRADWGCVPLCGTYARLDGASLPWVAVARLLQDGREAETGPHALSGLEVRRRAYVPPSGGYVRLLDVVANPTAAPIAFDYSLSQLLGSYDAAWALAATSSGDAAFDASDDWAAATHPGHPEVAYVAAGAGAVRRPDGVEWDATDPLWPFWRTTWTGLTVEPGQTVILVQFVVQRTQGDAAGAQAQAQALATLADPDALAGLTAEERAAIVNFLVP